MDDFTIADQLGTFLSTFIIESVDGDRTSAKFCTFTLGHNLLLLNFKDNLEVCLNLSSFIRRTTVI